MTNATASPETIDFDALAAAIAPRIAAELNARLRIDVLAGDDLILTADEAGRVLGRSPKTLELWRSLGTGPKAIQIGLRAIGYRMGDLRDYARSRPAYGRKVIEAALTTE